jgi:uracil-DNA glycosylase
MTGCNDARFSIAESLNGTSWLQVLAAELQTEYLKKLELKISEDWANGISVYPEKSSILRALTATQWNSVRVVIMGQDPYHGEGQANGLAFAVNSGIRLPPSIKNIYKELSSDIGLDVPPNATLTGWAEQGVLLLNSVLTVRAQEPLSHAGWGWERFTEAIVRSLNEHPEPIVFMLWGAPAQKKAAWVSNPRHLVLHAPHPSPLSAHRGFFGCRHFSSANDYLQRSGRTPVRWEQVDSV